MQRRPTLATTVVLLILLLASGGCQRAPTSPIVSGTIETDQARVASRYGGRVDRLFAWDGDSLTNGAPIVELDAAELRAQLAQATALLEELRAGPRPEEIATARAEWEALVAQLELARLEARRAVELFAQKILPETERDQAVSRATSLERNVAAARSRHELLLAGTRPEQIVRAAARVTEIEVQLREMRIVAPTNCLLEVLNVRVGDVLPPNREIATLVFTDHLWVRVFVPQPWLGFIQTGQKVNVTVDSFPGRDFEGVVEQIGRVAEFTPRNVQTPAERVKQVFGIKVRLHSPDLRAGMSADVTFPGVPTQERSPFLPPP